MCALNEIIGKENVFSNVKTPLDMIRKGTRMQKFGR
jgi:hypothetical protein